MAPIPKLLQLCAEQVATQTTDNKKLRKHLKWMQLPKVRIFYIKNDMFHNSCDFSRFIKRNMTNTIIIPSVPIGPENIDQVKITVGEEQLLYISTISDLGNIMLKLDMPTGEYGLCAFNKGYVLKMKNYHPQLTDAVQVYNTRVGNKGLSGTYHDGSTDNVNHVRIFNQYIREYSPEFEYRDDEIDRLNWHNNIPVLFYLTTLIDIKDLSKITLSFASETNSRGNIEVCWYVYHSVKGKIGIAVKQIKFFNMMGDQAGVCLLFCNGFRALGNFEYDYSKVSHDKSVFNHDYKCEFDPCFCDTMYGSKECIERKNLAIKRMEEYKTLCRNCRFKKTVVTRYNLRNRKC